VAVQLEPPFVDYLNRLERRQRERMSILNFVNAATQ